MLRQMRSLLGDHVSGSYHMCRRCPLYLFGVSMPKGESVGFAFVFMSPCLCFVGLSFVLLWFVGLRLCLCVPETIIWCKTYALKLILLPIMLSSS